MRLKKGIIKRVMDKRRMCDKHKNTCGLFLKGILSCS